MSRGFDGLKVVLTRPVGRASALLEALSELGAEVVEVPLLEVVPAPDGGASLRKGLAALAPGSWIAVTSAAAVTGLLAASSLEQLGAYRLAAVGEATAEALVAAALSPSLVGDGRGGGALAMQIPPPSAPGEPILLALAAEPMPALGEGLIASGYTPIVATAYATVPRKLSDEVISTIRAAEVLVLSSPKGVRLAAGALGDLRPEVVALGPTTADAARAAGFTRLVVAAAPGTAGVLGAFGVLLGTA
jgi:uroporphyrinogen III methyltransferase/synthase